MYMGEKIQDYYKENNNEYIEIQKLIIDMIKGINDRGKLIKIYSFVKVIYDTE